MSVLTRDVSNRRAIARNSSHTAKSLESWLSDLARLDELETTDSPQFAAINLGHASDTTISRASAGRIAVEGSNVLMASDIGASVQAYDADLMTWAGLTPSSDAQTLLAHTFAQMRSDLSLVPGTNVQAYDATLAALAGLTGSADTFAYFNGADTAALATVTSAARTLLAGASATAILALLLPIGIALPYSGSTAPTGFILAYGQAISRTTYSAYFAIVGTTYGSGDGSTTFNVPDYRGRVIAGKDNMGGSAASRLTNSGTGNPSIDGSTLGAAGGVDRHTLTLAQLAAHDHGAATGAGGDHSHGGATASSGAHTHSENAFIAQFGAGLAYDYQVSGGVYTAGNTTTSTSSEGAHTHTISASGTHTHSVSSAGSGNAHPIVQPTIVQNYIIFVGV